MLAGGISGLIYIYDTRSVQADRVENALKSARQIASLTEQLSARPIGPLSTEESDSGYLLSRAMKKVSQNLDPRWADLEVLKVRRWR